MVLMERKEKALTTLRSSVVLALVANPTLVALGVHLFFKSSETKHFRDTYATDIDKVRTTVAQGLIDNLRTVEGLATDIKVHARTTNSTWPFVAKTEYDLHASRALQQVHSLYFQVVVYVAPEERRAWEAFSVENDGWIQDGLDRQRSDPNFRGNTREAYQTIGQIWSYSLNYGIVPNNTYGYLPTWQCYPVFDFDPPYNFEHFDVVSACSCLVPCNNTDHPATARQHYYHSELRGASLDSVHSLSIA